MSPPLTRALLDWYDVQARVMPWRTTPGPYRTWISEIMLQQTRVETVVDYFERFTARFPTVEALAAAPEEEVLSIWAGLGYYSRARNLHRAAKAIVELGAFPSDRRGWQALPGIGPYTAGAITSIALGQVEPAVDGNIERVISRLFAFDALPKSPAGRRAIDAAVRSLLPADRPGDFNQALMDIGATICKPRVAACADCPMAFECKALEQDRTLTLPTKAPRRRQKRTPAVAAVLSRGGRLLLVRRPSAGLLGGLWGLPSERLGAEESAQAVLVRLLRERLGVEEASFVPLGQVEHQFTHLRWQATLFQVETEDDVSIAHYTDCAWVEQGQRSNYALSTLALKTLAVIDAARDA